MKYFSESSENRSVLTMEEKEPVTTLKQKCAQCLQGTNLIRALVVMVCTAVLVQQIAACVSKLKDRPITTYTHFDFNKTIWYPSVTFCREPPYKYEELMKHGLYAHPRYTSTWAAFNFSAITLDQLWNDITYTEEQFFAQYGLDGLKENVYVHSMNGFVSGRCMTLVPKAATSHASRETGYSVTLRHNTDDVVTSTSEHPPGYHVYIHYTREPFTEVQVYNGGLQDYMYIHTGETINAKLTVNQYVKISNDHEPCSHEDDFRHYSANMCTSRYVWDEVGRQVGCSGPWMISHLPRCYNYTGMTRLITAYMNTYDSHNNAECPRFCRSYLYNAYVVNRQLAYSWDPAQQRWAFRTGDAALQSQLYLYFESMMVSVYEERYNYDWNLFLADLGGSVGFLLGLSVVGVLSIFGKIWSSIIRPFIRPAKAKNDALSIISSSTTSTQEVNSKEQEMRQVEAMYTKCNEWTTSKSSN